MKRIALALLVSSASLAGFATPVLAQEDGFPVTLSNCGGELTLDAPAERIFMINNDDIPLLSALDALDRVVARTATPLEGIYADSVYDQLDKIPAASATTNSTGGSVISLETIIAATPDLVLAPQNAVDRDLLADAGIAAYSPPAYCNNSSDGPQGTASFERVYDQLRDYGQMLGETDLAEDKIAELEGEVAALKDLHAGSTATGVALYVSQGGKVLSPYGAFSMITPIFEAAGLENIYAETQQRVFDVNLEELIAKDPETVVLLYSSGSAQDLINTFLSVPGVEQLSAVEHDRVVALQFPYTDPPTPLSIKGASVLAEKLDALQ